MKLRCIERVLDDEDSWEGDIKCPSCGGIWYEFRDGGGAIHNTSCNHLRFICESDDEARCFNGFALSDLQSAVTPCLPKSDAPASTAFGEPDARSINDYIIEYRENPEFWRWLRPESINALFEFRERDSVLGSPGVVLFGAFFDPPLADAVDGDS